MPKHIADVIRIRGARQNNLKKLDLDLPLNELLVVTGVSGSGKSSLVFDTLYAEGQRRYVETFSPYARQFLERMDKPQVDRIEGIPPAIAIDQTNPVRTSRSTVGTMSELTDHVKLLYARAAQLYCRGCGRPVRRDSPDTIFEALRESAGKASDPRLIVTFPLVVPKNFSQAEVKQMLEQQGYTRIHAQGKNLLEVVQDRFRMSSAERIRVVEALEAALRVGQGRVNVYALLDGERREARGEREDEGLEPRASALAPAAPWKFSTALHCAECDIHYADPTPNLFSFNSPLGACETCRGFGRVIGIDFGLIVPDESKTLGGGAIKPWQTPSFHECQDDIGKYAKKRGIPLGTPWRDLSAAHRHWVLEGEAEWVSWKKSWPGTWYGVRRFFDWLETKSYKMHIRVLLSKYRAYTPCAACNGARLNADALLWRLGTRENAEGVIAAGKRFMPQGVKWSDAQLAALPGLTVHDLMLLPIDKSRAFFDALHLPAPLDEATEQLLGDIRARFDFLDRVGLGYLTLDRQSRTLSGGEVQRINLTTALGTSLTNTLFVLDEPSIGLHPRDMGRVIGVMQRLRDAGNSLVVVEHDPQIMLAADRILDIGPGPGERGGEVVFFGTPSELARNAKSLTGDYLCGRRRADAGIERAPVDSKTVKLEIFGAAEHNLKHIDVAIPLNRLVCITGVSGSGKSTLIQDVLYAALLKHKGKPTELPGAHRAIRGHERIAEVVMVDQTPIGRTTRSNPASYVGAWEPIRDLYAREPAAKERGYTPGTFSFNSGNGRCPTCGGNGFEHVEMQFLSDVYLRCPDCDGERFRAEVLELAVNGKSIADVLDMTVSEAAVFFADRPEVITRLQPLVDVGLEYMKLGQPVPTLSGGEAQRLKLAGHLVEAVKLSSPLTPHPSRERGTLFLFDEPTTGLHFDDVAKLLRALRKLMAAGHSLVVIEHNLDVIRASDWIVDLGPEGGDAGGEVMFTGTPEQITREAKSHTGVALKEYEQAIKQGAIARLEAAQPTRPSSLGPFPQEERELDDPSRLSPLASRPPAARAIHIHNAREHNLKNIDLSIPRERFTVVTGVSGSGKSTLAFDIVFAEGQRRYLESLNAYARQFVQPASRPDVDSVRGIPPTVAIEQRTSRGGSKSTVGTLTEIHHFLRLLFVKLGVQHCPECKVPIEPQSEQAIAARLMREYRGGRIGLLAPLVANRKGVYTELAKWARGKGHTHLRVDREFLPVSPFPRIDRFKEHAIELPVADLEVRPGNENALREALKRALEYGKGTVHVIAPLDRIMKGEALVEQVFSTKRACPSCGRSFAELDPRMFSYNSKHGWCPDCYGTGLQIAEVGWDEERTRTGAEDHVLDSWIEWLEVDESCPQCEGKRLNHEALAVLWRGRSIADFGAQPVAALAKLFADLELGGREREIARDLLAELGSRLGFLAEVGLDYLTLDRSAPTLSGGEAQRIRLAAQLGSNLRGVCYILDEPTIGLHPRDNRILLDTLEKLEAKGNTLLVVEHDEDTIRRAHHLVDLGPGAGRLGGRVVAQGTIADLMKAPESVTGHFLARPLRHPLVDRRETTSGHPALEVAGACMHNLKNIDVRIPLARLTCVTGVSGSGKSTLARAVLYANLQRLVAARRDALQPKAQGGRRKAKGKKTNPSLITHHSSLDLIGCRSIGSADQIGRVLEVDQAPIGKTPRSCPATYIGFWDAIRKLFAATTEARMRGYEPARFSFNTSGGRCEGCEGQGVKKIEMSFLPDVKVSCEVCGGRRFNQETLAVRFKGKSIGEVLIMSVDEAVEFFSAHVSIHHALRLLQDVGLGYLTLGQQSPTLSGGEAQRIKLVTELTKVRLDVASATGEKSGRKTPLASRHSFRALHTLYVLDEPTVGLHMADVEKLIRVLHRLVDAGNTVVVIEHNLDVMSDANWIVDLGPAGGDGGGCVVAEGPPGIVAKTQTHTGKVLKEFLQSRGA